MLEIAFPGVEIMLVFPGIKASIVFLNNLSLLNKELALFILHFFLFFIHKLATANISSVYSLHFESGPFLVIELPLHFEHPPVLLNNYSCGIFFVSEFFGFVQHCEILVYEISMTAFTFL